MKKIGNIFKFLGFFSYIIFGLWGFIVEITFIYSMWGILGALIGIVLFPAILTLVPFYILIIYGNWNLILIIYGGAVLASILYLIGNWLSKEE